MCVGEDFWCYVSQEHKSSYTMLQELHTFAHDRLMFPLKKLKSLRQIEHSNTDGYQLLRDNEIPI